MVRPNFRPRRTIRPSAVQHYWDTWNGSGYTSSPIIGNVCQYETSTSTSAKNRGLKLTSAIQVNTGGTWANERNPDQFTYDPQRDFLVGAAYHDGNSNPSQSWSYDPAGNRNDVTVDNLNRTGHMNGSTFVCDCDILGNRLSNNAGTTYQRDLLNRMTSLNANSYVYRGDGMRVQKTVGTTTTVYRYAGQMGFEDVDTTGSSVTVDDYALGPRGIDAISRTTSSGTTISYPPYDDHGNVITTHSKGSQ